MSTIKPTTEFNPTDVSDVGLAELRRLALSATTAAPKFGQWLHQWCDAEQYRRGTKSDTATRRHAVGLPLMAEWSDPEVGEALEAVGVLVHNVSEFTASQFAERLQLATTMEAGHRLRTRSEGTTNANGN